MFSDSLFSLTNIFSAREETARTEPLTKRFTGAKKPITLEFVKGTLLVIADQMVGTLSDVIQENAEVDGGCKFR